MAARADKVLPLWRRYPWLLRGAALVFCAIAVLLPTVLSPQSVARLEDGLGDAFWRFNASTSLERRVVLVDIDEKSLRVIGPWPWSRSTLAELSVRLQQAGARAQAFDINFSDPRVGDADLVAAWQRTLPVVSQVFSLDPTVSPAVGTVAGPLSAPGCPAFAPQATGHYGTEEALLAARPVLGHITPRVAADGVVRHAPALVCHDGRAYASLALAALWRATQPDAGSSPSGDLARTTLPAPDWRWVVNGARDPAATGQAAFISGLAPAAWLTSASLPGVVVPLDAHGNLRVPYTLSRQAFVSVSASDLLKDAADLSLLRGAIVLVGATAFGIGDTVATPQSAVAAGLEVHAQSLVGLLDQRIPYTPQHWPVLQLGVMAVVAGLLLVVALGHVAVPAKRLPLFGLALALALLAGVALAAMKWSLWLPWWPVVGFALLASLALATVEHALVRAQRERLSAHLGAYLPAPVAKRLMTSDPSGSLQLEQRHISVLVSSIRNFNALASHAQPDEVATLLHSYCCQAVDVIEKHGGVVDNVVGDSIVAVWTAEPSSAEHAMKAVAAAQELLRVSRSLLTLKLPVAENSLVQPLALGIGLESGLAIVGSFGPARRRAHAALGEPVSVANRIQQMTADLSMPVLVGPQLASCLPNDGVEPLGDYLLEGLGKPYALFAPVGWGDLAPVDSSWAQSVAAPVEPSQESNADWSRWGDANKPGASGSLSIAGLSVLRRLSA